LPKLVWPNLDEYYSSHAFLSIEVILPNFLLVMGSVTGGVLRVKPQVTPGV
ncbi:hypothetical protein ACJX0J_036998, partial [Zea mays]